MSYLFDILRSDGSVMVNKRLMRRIGIHATMLYSEILSKESYFRIKGEMTEDGYFFNTVSHMEYDTGLSKFQQAEALNILLDKGLVFRTNRGMPKKRYFKVNYDQRFLEAVLNEEENIKSPYSSQETKPQWSNNSTTSGQEIEPPVVKKMAINNTNYNTNNNTKLKDKEISSSDKSLDDAPVKKTNPNDELIDVTLNYLNQLINGKFKLTTKSNRNFINARIKDGYEWKDLQYVINNKVAEWKGTDMSKFLRPSTLFNPTNFENYINEKPYKPKQQSYKGGNNYEQQSSKRDNQTPKKQYADGINF